MRAARPTASMLSSFARTRKHAWAGSCGDRASAATPRRRSRCPAIFSCRSALPTTAVAAGLSLSSTPENVSLNSAVVPSLYCETPSALRQSQTV